MDNGEGRRGKKTEGAVEALAFLFPFLNRIYPQMTQMSAEKIRGIPVGLLRKSASSADSV
jgi:hypothetical protein